MEKGADIHVLTISDIYHKLNINLYEQINGLVDSFNVLVFAQKIKLLLENGLELHNENNCTEKILMKLVEINHRDSIESIKTLIKEDDIDVDYKYDGFTLLLHAMAKNNIEAVELLLNYGANYMVKTDSQYLWDSKTFLAFLDIENPSHMKIYERIKEMDFDKKYMEKIVRPCIKMTFSEFTLNPSSIHSRTLAIKWDLNKDDGVDVYNRLKENNSSLLAYYGISDGQILQLKIKDHLAHV